MSIIDTLAHYGGQSHTFTVNTAVNYVDITVPVGDGILSIGGVFNTFQWKDQINLLSVMIHLPLGFEFYEWYRGAPGNIVTPHFVGFKWRNAGTGALTGFSPNRYNLPGANYELSLGAFLTPDNAVNGNYNLVANVGDAASSNPGRVSMINVPAALNGLTFSCPVIAKVEHTLPLL